MHYYYPGFITQQAWFMASLGRESIRETWLNIYATVKLKSNRKLIAQLILHLLDYF